jgi:hypothetical protein
MNKKKQNLSNRKLLNMKNIIIAFFLFFTVALSAQDKKETPKTMIVEHPAGNVGMKGYACDPDSH